MVIVDGGVELRQPRDDGLWQGGSVHHLLLAEAQIVERRTRGRKVASLNPGRSGGRNVFSSADFLC